MSNSLRISLIALFGAFALGMLYSFSEAAQDALRAEWSMPFDFLQPQLVTSEPAHDFSLPDRDGRVHRLSALRGRPLLLNFWSKDCPPCVEELPALVRLDLVARERGTFSVVTVTVDASWAEVRRLFPDTPPPLLVLFDPERAVVQELYGTRRFPETFLIDSGGNIRARFDGQRNWDSPLVLNLLETL